MVINRALQDGLLVLLSMQHKTAEWQHPVNLVTEQN